MAAVFTAIGYSENSLTPEQGQLEGYAQDHDLQYIPPRNPADMDFSEITPESTVILRGTGLTFYDDVTLLTSGRGGTFSQNPDQTLTYHPSGHEPKILATSRRGWPYHAKGRNQKAYGEELAPKFLTPDFLNQFKHDQPLPYDEFWDKWQLELQYIYSTYWLKVHQSDKLAAFQKDFLNLNYVSELPNLLDRYHFPADQRLDLDTQIDPTVALDDDELAHFTAAVEAFLKRDADAAALGTKTGPLTSALEMIRDLRDAIRTIVEGQLFSDDTYLNQFQKAYNRASNFLSVGPPLQRLRELAALVKAGIVQFAGPHAKIRTDAGKFRLDSDLQTDTFWLADTLIESRLPAENVLTATNPLLTTLLANETIHSYRLQAEDGSWVDTGAVDVARQSNQVITGDGQELKNFFIWGISTEGLHWLTSASPRPGVNDFFLQEADYMVATMVSNFHGKV